MKRYPIQPLLDAMRMTLSQATKSLGVSGQMTRSAKVKGLGLEAAYRWADNAGLHPYSVWPEMLDDVLDDCQRECAWKDCHEKYIPRQSTQRYCSRKCKNKACDWRYNHSKGGKAARSRHRREKRAEANREYRHRYYAENGDYERARGRAYTRRTMKPTLTVEMAGAVENALNVYLATLETTPLDTGGRATENQRALVETFRDRLRTGLAKKA